MRRNLVDHRAPLARSFLSSDGFSRRRSFFMLIAVLHTLPALPFCHVALKTEKPKSAKYPKNLKTLGDHIRKKRLELGLLQKEVASRMGVDAESIYRWETNRASP